jgi:Zn-dependent protease with chaperone function
MPFLLMVFLTLVCLPPVKAWPAPLWTESPAWCALLTGLGVALTAFNARRLARGLTRGFRRDPAGRERLLRRYERGRFRHNILLFTVYVLSLVVFGWGWAVGTAWHAGPGAQDETPGLPGTELLLLAPFLLAQLLSWAFFYDADRASYQAAQRLDDLDPLGPAWGEPRRTPAGFGSRASYVLFQARQKLALVFLPVLLLIVHKELQRLFPPLGDEWEGAANVVGCALLLGVFVTLPWMVRLVLGLRPLPDGPVRDRLLAASRRLGFRCSNLLLWNTRSGMANAMVIGIVPWVRYVVFTDRLLEDFSPDEVEAVFGHEVGHVKHQHMLYYLGFLLVSVIVLGSLVKAADGYLSARFPPDAVATPAWLDALHDALQLDNHGYLALLPMVGILLSYIFIVFGFLSRRCERQADIYGCRAVSCGRRDCAGHDPEVALPAGGRGLCPTGIRIFMRALDKVALVNGISRDRPGFLQSWQHSTIARRVEFLQRMLADPFLERHFQRRVALVKWALLGALCLALAVLLHTTGL